MKKLGDLDFDLSRPLTVKCEDAIIVPIYGFLLIVNTVNTVLLRDTRPRNLGDLDFDLSISLKVRCDAAVGLPIYGFLLMVNCNAGFNYAPLSGLKIW